MTAKNYRADIDGLRAVAVIPVVLYHAGVPSFGGGFIGVDIFFVISGYLIAGIIHREIQSGTFTIAAFYERRARRILPALFAVLIFSLVAGWFLLLPEAFEDLGFAILTTSLFGSNIWFWKNTGGYFDRASEFEPLLHTWSLAVEEQFYIFFPLLLLLLARRSGRFQFATIVVLCGASFLLSVFAVYWREAATFYLLPMRAWELGAGVLLAISKNLLLYRDWHGYLQLYRRRCSCRRGHCFRRFVCDRRLQSCH